MVDENTLGRVVPAFSAQAESTAPGQAAWKHYDVLTASYPERSCLVFRKSSKLRRACVHVCHSKVFENFVLFTILCNCVTLGLSSSRKEFDSTPLGQVLAKLDYLFIAVFTSEMILKVISMGFVLKKGTYLRDGWNVLDFIVVMVSYLSLVKSQNLTSLRTVRALRPLRAVRRIKGMRVLVTTMLGSLPMLFDVFVLCAFTFLLFGIVAVQLFAGVLRNRCGSPDFSGAYNVTLESHGGGGGNGGGALWSRGDAVLGNVSYVVPEDAVEEMCSGPLSSEVVWYPSDGNPIAVSGKPYTGQHCDNGMYCTAYGNPYNGFVSYDNILWSWLTIFQHITLSGWSDVMYMMMDAVNYWVWIYYVGFIIFGAFFMINLALAVLSVNFSSDKLKERAETERQAEMELLGPAGRSGQEAAEGLSGRTPASMSVTGMMARLRQSKRDADPTPTAGSLPPPGLGQVRSLAWQLAVSRGLEFTTATLILVNTVVMCINWYGMSYKVEQITNYINYSLTVYFAVELCVRTTAFGLRFFRDGMNIFDTFVVVVSVAEMITDLVPSLSGVGPLSVLRAFRLLRIFRLARHWKEFNTIIRGMMNSVQASIMLLALMLLFLFISALIGKELFGYKFMFCDYVEGARAICPPGKRVWGDCPNHFYCYLPCSEGQYGDWVDAPGSFYNGLAYCDRFCASEDDDGAVTVAAAAASANVSGVGGGGGGGCEYHAMVGKSQVPRANFDNVLWGIYTVFQLLTGEDWNDIMYDGMKTVSKWSSLYFVGVIVLGNYLFFNLFIAILLDNLHFKVDEENPNLIGSKHGSSEDSSISGDDKPNRGGLPEPANSTATAFNGASLTNRDLDEDKEKIAESRASLDEGGRELKGHEGDDSGETAGPPRRQFPNEGIEVQEHAHEVDRGIAQEKAQGVSATATAGLKTQVPPAAIPEAAVATAGIKDTSAPTAAATGVEMGTTQAVNVATSSELNVCIPSSKPSAVAEATEMRHSASPAEATAVTDPRFEPSVRNAAPKSAGTRLRWDDSALLAPLPDGSSNGSGGGGVAAPNGSYDDNTSDWVEHDRHRERDKLTEMKASRCNSRATLNMLEKEGTTASWPYSQEASRTRIPRQSSKSILSHLKNLGAFATRRNLGSPWKHAIAGRSLLLFPPENRVRCGAAKLVQNRYFDAGIMVLILASCVCLVLDSPSLDPESKLEQALQILDYIFTGAFTLEAVLKIVTFGFAFTGKHAYIRSGWNVLDLFIVLLGWALIIVEAVGVGDRDLKALRVLRAFRALRSLRAAHRFHGLRIVVSALFAVLPAMVNVALVCMFFYLIFAILAVNLFKGKLYYCIEVASGERIDPFYVLPGGQELTRQWCEAGKQIVSQSAHYSRLNVTMPEYTIITQWIKPANNFDNVGVAILTLFQAATLSMWVDITFSAVDAVGVDKQPLWNHRPVVILLFILFLVVCSFFVLNLFIGVTLDKFSELHEAEKETNSLHLSPKQQTWVDVQLLLIRTRMEYKPPRPHHRVRSLIYSVVQHPLFDMFMIGIIICNVAFMAMVRWNMAATWQAIMSYSNMVFTCIFIAEALLKFIAFGPLGYFRCGWNRLDFFVVVASVVSVVLDFSNTHNVSFMPVLRVLRIARVVRLVRNATGMQKLLRTLYDSLPALANVGGVMLLFFFIFAVIGVNLFAGIKQDDNLTRHANFDTFPNAMLLLFRMITGEGWNGIMLDCMKMGGCVMVVTDINITLSNSASFSSLPLSAHAVSNATTTVVSLLSGAYLDASDPLLSSLPANATDDQCPLSPVAAAVYFPVFVVFCTFILLQLVIAVLLENLTQAESDAELPISKSCVESFVDAWSDVDGTASGFIHASQLIWVVCATQAPLGTAGSFNFRVEAQERLLQLDIPLYDENKVSFIEVLYALSGAVCGTQLPEEAEAKLVHALSKRVPTLEPYEDHTAGQYHAALSVAAAIRGFLLRRNYEELLQEFQVQTTDRLGSVGAAAMAAVKFRKRAAATAAATSTPVAVSKVDGNMLINGHRLGDVRRELLSGSHHTLTTPRRLRPILAGLPPIAPLRTHRLQEGLAEPGVRDPGSPGPVFAVSGQEEVEGPGRGQAWASASRREAALSLTPLRPRSTSLGPSSQSTHLTMPPSNAQNPPAVASPPVRTTEPPVPEPAQNPSVSASQVRYSKNGAVTRRRVILLPRIPGYPRNGGLAFSAPTPTETATVTAAGGDGGGTDCGKGMDAK